MRTVLSLFVIIAAAVACPLLKNLKKPDCSCDVPKICPSTWNIQRFESQYVSNKKTRIKTQWKVILIYKLLYK